MLSKGLIKLVNSLRHKKFRQLHGLFIAEGQKMINDLIKIGSPIKTIISAQNKTMSGSFEFVQCKANELGKISSLKTSQDVIALVKMPDYQYNEGEISNRLSLALDGVQDPGNMGTIIRIASWFGIENILCSIDCVDIYNPKVVQASMGALMKVKVHYLELSKSIAQLAKNTDYKIYGTFMNGDSIYESELLSKGLIVMGNEGQGISVEIENLINKRIAIPSYAVEFGGAESLNVAVSTGIVVSEFSRRKQELRN